MTAGDDKLGATALSRVSHGFFSREGDEYNDGIGITIFCTLFLQRNNTWSEKIKRKRGDARHIHAAHGWSHAAGTGKPRPVAGGWQEMAA